MKKETIKSSQLITISKMSYNQVTRNQEFTDMKGEIHKMPKETSWTKIVKPGHTITIIAYEEDQQIFYQVEQAGFRIGHYGPLQKAQRDSLYKFETSRKASDLIREEQINQAHEAFYED